MQIKSDFLFLNDETPCMFVAYVYAEWKVIEYYHYIHSNRTPSDVFDSVARL